MPNCGGATRGGVFDTTLAFYLDAYIFGCVCMHARIDVLRGVYDRTRRHFSLAICGSRFSSAYCFHPVLGSSRLTAVEINKEAHIRNAEWTERSACEHGNATFAKHGSGAWERSRAGSCTDSAAPDRPCVVSTASGGPCERTLTEAPDTSHNNDSKWHVRRSHGWADVWAEPIDP